MKGKRVFAVHYNGMVYSVYKQDNEKVKGLSYYCTYIGRKRFDVRPWYNFTNAVGSILDSVGEFDKEVYKVLW